MEYTLTPMERRAMDKEGNLISNTFLVYNEESNEFETRSYKDYLIQIGVYEESDEFTDELNRYYEQMQSRIN